MYNFLMAAYAILIIALAYCVYDIYVELPPCFVIGSTGCI